MSNNFSETSSQTSLHFVWRVAVVAPEESFRSIKWLFRDESLSNEKIDFTNLSISKLKETQDDFDFCVLLLDLGQPVPRQHILDMPKMPGLCALVQPTPHQLLQVSDVVNWRAVKWVQSDFAALGMEIIKTVECLGGALKQDHLLGGLNKWISINLELPRRATLLSVDSNKEVELEWDLGNESAHYTVGESLSGATISFPKNGSRVYGEFVSTGKSLSFNKLDCEGVFFQIQGDPQNLSAGDTLQFDGFQLALKASSQTEELVALLEQFGLDVAPKELHSGKVFESQLELFREFMLSAMTGELRISAGTKKASIFLESGRIQQVLCGAVYGEKALLRVFSWSDFKWSFNLNKRSRIKLANLDISYLELSNMFARWSTRWTRLAAYAPPSQLKISIQPDIFKFKESWTAQDFLVAASVCQFETVGDIMNNCSLLDTEILDSLVRLRKESLLAIS